MKSRLLVAVALPMLFTGAPATRADQKGEALFKQVIAATKAAKTLTGDLSMTMQGGRQKQNIQGKVRLMKPNYARIELGAPVSETIASDGKTLWMLMKEQAQYMKQTAAPQGQNISVMWAIPVQFFFNAAIGSMLPVPGEPKPTLLAPETVDGQKYQVLGLDAKEPPMNIKLYVGPTKLLQRMTVEMKRGDDVTKFAAALKNVKLNAPMTAAQFAYRPPRTAELYKEPDLNAKLVAVGKNAPDFDLATPSGGQVSLKEAVQGKKAVLVNFWFYN